MRKLLLASAATVGMVGSAWAQAPAGAPIPVGVTGVPAAPTTYLGGNNALNSSGAALPNSPIAPTPGTMVVHINGRVWAGFGVEGSSATVVPGNKLAPEQLIGFFRLYPGVDAQATNGLRYGAIVEIRQNFIGQTYGSTTAGLRGAASANGSSPSGSSSGSTLYVRREAVYFGSNEAGIVRIGQDDGPFSQFDGGVTTFQTFGSGAWNGDGPDNIPGAASPTFPFWSGVGNEYTPEKAVYFSPNFAGFDFAASFAPNNAPSDGTACSVAAAGCAAASAVTGGGFGGENRATNIVEVMGRYRGNFSGLGVYAIAGYAASGHVHVGGSNIGGTGGHPAAYNGFSTGDFGLVLSYAGFSVGGNALIGNYNGQVQLEPAGGVHAVAWVAGAQYNFGPYGIGASYFNYQSQGSAARVGLNQRYDDGLAVGASYAVAPGLLLTADYLYGQVYQGGVNLITGATGTTTNNNVHSQSFVLESRVQW